MDAATGGFREMDSIALAAGIRFDAIRELAYH